MTEEQHVRWASRVGTLRGELFDGQPHRHMESCLGVLIVATAAAMAKTADRQQMIRFQNELHLQLDQQLGLESQSPSPHKATILRGLLEEYDDLLAGCS